ncbi:hypothetical protein [Aeoliella mucimassa]|uniref:Uncharacterized protein n=1 Tax=Aeoliella mucimassa TaxID=2527972 RepID=A0A518AP16_9BACT|nr:hypothetical protein [Aeoliella mucimassa]QDU56457.1 hypothetical protein Pan181_26660 [Aeoliella mucimassa]
MAAEPYLLRPLCINTSCFPTVATLLLAMVLLGTTGCKNTPSSLPSPFLADRVPPPDSRIPAPGTADPYYQGGAVTPLPSTQPMVQPFPGTQPMTQPVPATMQPGVQPLGALTPSQDITPLPANDAVAEFSAPASSHSFAGEEVAVSIPSDEQAMRFAMVPEPAQPSAAQAANAPVANLAMQTGPAPTTTATVLHDSTAANSTPTTAPTITNWPPAVNSTSPSSSLTDSGVSGNASGLFRDPTVPTQAPELYQEQTPQPIQQTTVPRVRVPGAAERIREEVVPGNVNTTSYQVGFAGGGNSTTMAIPPSGIAIPATFAPEGSTNSIPSGDGFRTRGTSHQQASPNQGPTTLMVTPG